MPSRLTGISVPPDVFAAVMATGIVSIAADDHDFRSISDALDTVAIVGMAAVGMFALRAVRRWDYRDPDIVLRLFSFVAACAVLATRLQTHRGALWALGVLAVLAWLVLAPLAARDMWSRGWIELRDHAHGGWELASVATSAVAIMTAELTVATRSDALVVVSALTWVLAMMVYALMTSLILWRAATGATFHPDHWILMGGLAIATLAGARLHAAAQAVDSWVAHGCRLITVATWVLATAWIPVLLCAHLLHISRRVDELRFAGAWWAAVFPLGMYSAATQATALEMRWAALTQISLVFFWIALTVWLVVAFGGLRRLTAFLSRPSSRRLPLKRCRQR